MSSYFEVTTVFFHSELKFNANFILLNYFHTLLLVFSRLSKPILKKWGRGGVKDSTIRKKSYIGLIDQKERYIFPEATISYIERLKIRFVQFQSNDCEFNAQIP